MVRPLERRERGEREDSGEHGEREDSGEHGEREDSGEREEQLRGAPAGASTHPQPQP